MARVATRKARPLPRSLSGLPALACSMATAAAVDARRICAASGRNLAQRCTLPSTTRRPHKTARRSLLRRLKTFGLHKGENAHELLRLKICCVEFEYGEDPRRRCRFCCRLVCRRRLAAAASRPGAPACASARTRGPASTRRQDGSLDLIRLFLDSIKKEIHV